MQEPQMTAVRAAWLKSLKPGDEVWLFTINGKKGKQRITNITQDRIMFGQRYVPVSGIVSGKRWIQPVAPQAKKEPESNALETLKNTTIDIELLLEKILALKSISPQLCAPITLRKMRDSDLPPVGDYSIIVLTGTTLSKTDCGWAWVAIADGHLIFIDPEDLTASVAAYCASLG